MIQAQNSPGVFELPVRVRVKDGERKWTFNYPGNGMLTIGRSDDCEVVLATTKASRKHAQIFGEGGRFTLVDNGSANGVRVNGNSVKSHPLQPGDRIQIGESVITFGEPKAVEAAPATKATPKAAAKPAAKSAVKGSPKAATEDGDEGDAPRRAVRSRGSRTMSQVIPAVLLLILLSLVVAYLLEREGGGDTPPANTGTTETAAVEGDTPAATEESDDWTAAVGELDPERAVKGLKYILDEMRSGETGWDAIEELEALAREYPKSRSGQEAKKLAGLFRGVQKELDRDTQRRSDRTLDAILKEESFGAAIAVCGFLARSSGHPETRTYWKGRGEEIEAQVRNRFVDIEEQLGQFVADGQGAEALRALVDLRVEYGGSTVYNDLLAEYLEAGLRARKKAPKVERTRSRDAGPLLDRAVVAFKECRFRDLKPIYHLYLTYDLSPADRIRGLEQLVDSQYYVSMFDTFMEKVSEKPLDVDLGGAHPGKIVGADEEGIQYEIEIGGGTILEKKQWKRLSTAQKYQVFDSTSYEPEAILGLALYALRNGYDEGGHAALIRLSKRKSQTELVSAVLSRHLGIPVPEEGYVVYKGRLVRPSEKAELIALRERQRAEEKERLAELKRLKKGKRADVYIEWAKKLRQEGRYEKAHEALTELAYKAKDLPEGAEAQRLLDDPYLSWHVMKETGPRENRLDFSFLAEGYTVNDAYQSQFMHSANSCMRILLTQEPYREYQSYLNFNRIHLGSKEKGVDLVDRDIWRETPLNAKVEYGVLTCDRAKVMEFLGKAYGEFHDGQGIMIANEFASVATGGGGVVSLSYATVGLADHEIGHSLSGLRDEYEQEPSSDPNREKPVRKPGLATMPFPPNLMQGSDHADIMRKAVWRYWIDAGEEMWWNGQTVGAFEGGNRQPFNYWRPQASCTMRDSGTRFCVVCMEQMILSIYRYVRPIDRVEPSTEEDVVLGPNDKFLLKVWPMKPETHFLEAKWYIRDLGIDTGGSPSPEEEDDNTGLTGVDETDAKRRRGQLYKRFTRVQDATGRWVEVAQIKTKDLRPGRYRVRVEMHDPTPWVIRDPQKLLHDSREWILRIKSE